MSWGNKTTTNQTATSSNTSSNTTTPNLTASQQTLENGNNAYASNIEAQAQAPVFGDAQMSNYLQGLNTVANNSINSLSSTLASKGALNSGALATGAAGIEQGVAGQESNFLGQLPFQQQQQQLAQENAALGSANQTLASQPKGQTSTGMGMGTQDTNTVQTQDEGMGQLLGQLGGAAIGGLTGGLMGGGGIVSGVSDATFSQAMNQDYGPTAMDSLQGVANDGLSGTPFQPTYTPNMSIGGGASSLTGFAPTEEELPEY